MKYFETINNFIREYGPEVVPTHEENREHFRRILACEDNTELDAFVFANIRLVASVVTKFLKRHRPAIYLIDDMFSEGIFQLFSSLKVLIEDARKDPERFWAGLGRVEGDGEFHVLMYLYISVYRGVQRSYEFDAVRAISKTWAARFTPEHSDEPIRKVQISDYWFEQIGCDPFSLVFLFEDILEHCRTDLERDVITLRVSIRDVEIASKLGCSRQLVAETRKRVYKRYQTSLGEFNAD